MAEHAVRGGLALLDRGVPVLDAEPPAQDRVQRVGHVAGGEHVGVGAGQPRVDQDAVVGRQPGGLGERDVGRHPDADHDQVGLDRATVRQAYDGPRAVLLDAGDLDARAQVDAVLGVQVGEDLGDLGAEHPQQRQVERLEDRDGGARLARGGRGLQADPAAADDHHPGAVGERLLAAAGCPRWCGGRPPARPSRRPSAGAAGTTRSPAAAWRRPAARPGCGRRARRCRSR